MIPTGCTCTNRFTIPYNADTIDCLSVTYTQNRRVVLKKRLPDCAFENGCVCVNLSQEDALLFNEQTIVRIQLKVKLTDGTVTKSNIIEVTTDEVLDKEAI